MQQLSKNRGERTQNKVIKISQEKAQDLVYQLWTKITNDGWYANSKVDIYDFLLYLFNKYDENSFFDKRSLSQNERLLKISATKIKSAKKNIAIKFMDNAEYEAIFEDVLKILSNDENLKDDEENKEYFTLIIENPAQLFSLGSKLKEIAGDTLKATSNPETFRIKKESLIKVLKTTLVDDDQKEELVKKIQAGRFKHKLINFIDAVSKKFLVNLCAKEAIDLTAYILEIIKKGGAQDNS